MIYVEKWPERKRQKADELNRIAAEMREQYLNHGIGCKSRRRAIEQRESDAAHERALVRRALAEAERRPTS